MEFKELTFNVNNVEFSMMPIASGSFMMGSPETEPGRDKKETQHQVTLTKSFYIGKYEVTQALYEAVKGINPSEFKDDKNNPVEKVSWNDAKEFCYILNKLTTSTRLILDLQ